MKKTCLFLLLFIFLPAWVIAQRNYTIGITGGLDYSNRNLRGAREITESLDAQERGSLGYRLGADVGISLGQRFTLKTGIRYLVSGYGTKDLPNLTEEAYDPQTGRFTTVSGSMRYRYEFYYLEIPLGIRYRLGKKRLTGFIEGGITGNIYLGNKMFLKTESGFNSSGRIRDLDAQKIIPGIYLSLGLQYQLKSGLQLFLQPTGRYNLSAFNKNGEIQYYLYSIGAEFGARYQFPARKKVTATEQARIPD